MTLADLLPAELSARLDSLDLHSRKVFAGKMQGERRSKQQGRSVEFEEHREYVPGDDLRHIDWNVFARLDRFFLKIFQEEEDLGLQVVLDASASMIAGSPSKLLFAARVAMALGYVGLVRNNRVSVAVIGGAGGAARLTPVRGRHNVQRLGAFLLEHAFVPAPPHTHSDRPGVAGGNPGTAFTAECRAVAASRQGKGVLVLLSDLLIPPPDGYQPGLRLLAAPAGTSGASFDVVVMQVLSPGEIDPAVEGKREGPADFDTDLQGPVLGDLALTDVETGRVADVTVTADLLRTYRAAAQKYVQQARDFCTARGISHLLLTSDTDVPGLVLDTLRRRGLLR